MKNWIKRGHLFGHDWYFRIGRRVEVLGVNSLTWYGSSVLFWEFDGYSLAEVTSALLSVQKQFNLPKIHVLQASTKRSYHAVCMKAFGWPYALGIVATTEMVDPDYIRLAAQRQHFTLRLTDKGQGSPRVVKILESNYMETAHMSDLCSGVRYRAWVRDGG